ncbi:MAG: pyruvate, phosphate dikinase, partial [bacterium]|nr:pyruvate, phosphate dikinase [bacterium]
MADKAVTYRRVEKITGLNGTAVNICQMVFGNMGDDCGTGVCFTRDPSTGENVYYGDLLMNAQGEDVVAGVRTPVKLDRLSEIMPDVYDQLEAVRAMLEVHYQEMQDLEFTIERHKLYILQCRTGKRSPAATFKIAVDQATQPVIPAAEAQHLAKKGYLPARYAKAAAKPIITKKQAIARIKPEDLERLFYPIIDSTIERSELENRRLATGIGAVPGAACGQIVFSSETAEAWKAQDKNVVLICKETSPEDVGGMHAAVGILTATGGKTSHAAVVARGWGKCCIVGCDALNIDHQAGTLAVNGHVFREGDYLTLDGGTGDFFDGRLDLARPAAPPEYDTLMGWCDDARRLKVRTNADTPGDAAQAISLGAEGTGLCRTEHMSVDPSEPLRLRAMREMILARDEGGRRRALDKLLPFQQRDFEGIFEAMAGKPVTVRLLDPPLHEFLPGHDNVQAQQEAADDLNTSMQAELDGIEDWDTDRRAALEGQTVTVEDVQHRVDQLHESNPMLGHRGCRLCITYPEILEMQVRAIIDAAIACHQRGIEVLPEIMIPLSIDATELGLLVDRTHKVARERLALAEGDTAQKLRYMVGTMIETPRAALTADKVAEVSEFFSFGTNDLTQTTMALSRDDAGRFLPEYVDQDRAGIFEADPFEQLDVDGVGQLVRMGLEKGRATKPKLKVGICGEHGGELNSVKFCHTVGMDYVSCSPFRVPIARLAAAQAVFEESIPKRRPASRSKRKAAASKKAAKKKVAKK